MRKKYVKKSDSDYYQKKKCPSSNLNMTHILKSAF